MFLRPSTCLRCEQARVPAIGPPETAATVQGAGSAQQKPSPHHATRCSRCRKASSIPSKRAFVVTGDRSSVTASAVSRVGAKIDPFASTRTVHGTSATIAGRRRSPAIACSTGASHRDVPSMWITASAPSTSAQAPSSKSAQGPAVGPSQVRTAYPRRSMADAMIDGELADGHSSRTRTLAASLSSHRGWRGGFLMARPPGLVSVRLSTWAPPLGSGRVSPAVGRFTAIQTSDTREQPDCLRSPHAGGAVT